LLQGSGSPWVKEAAIVVVALVHVLDDPAFDHTVDFVAIPHKDYVAIA
tara:strand:+ start:164 stop:307 length:144 start_codon:yes stop_codon:yes gene_type:complete